MVALVATLVYHTHVSVSMVTLVHTVNMSQMPVPPIHVPMEAHAATLCQPTVVSAPKALQDSSVNMISMSVLIILVKMEEFAWI